MLDLQEQLKLAYLFISHDMAVVERVSHRVAVMYLGEIVEIGPRDLQAPIPADLRQSAAPLYQAAARRGADRRRVFSLCSDHSRARASRTGVLLTDSCSASSGSDTSVPGASSPVMIRSRRTA
jgi:ABC-type dipeptide/oligopeptide/nickel transport system ATPase component